MREEHAEHPGFEQRIENVLGQRTGRVDTRRGGLKHWFQRARAPDPTLFDFALGRSAHLFFFLHSSYRARVASSGG